MNWKVNLLELHQVRCQSLLTRLTIANCKLFRLFRHARSILSERSLHSRVSPKLSRKILFMGGHFPTRLLCATILQRSMYWNDTSGCTKNLWCCEKNLEAGLQNWRSALHGNFSRKSKSYENITAWTTWLVQLGSNNIETVIFSVCEHFQSMKPQSREFEWLTTNYLKGKLSIQPQS